MTTTAIPRTAPSVELATGWQAALTLGFAPLGARTELVALEHRGPLRVQRTFHPQPDGTCHVYVLHPPGGMVGGDRLQIDVAVAAGARALITTPAAGKIYRTAGATAVVEQRCRIAAGGCLEWLPQENIVFGGSRSRLTTRVDLADAGDAGDAGDARFLGWDLVVLGRPAAGDHFAHGSARVALEIERGGRPVFLERSHLEGGSPLLAEPWGLGGHAAMGTLVVAGAPDPAALVSALRQRLDDLAPNGRHATTALGAPADLVVCRALAAEAEDVRAWLTAAWSLARAIVVGSPAVAPRVWST